MIIKGSYELKARNKEKFDLDCLVAGYVNVFQRIIQSNQQLSLLLFGSMYRMLPYLILHANVLAKNLIAFLHHDILYIEYKLFLRKRFIEALILMHIPG